MAKMLKGTDKDVSLIVNIVNECDIENSLLYILALIPHKYDEKLVFATPIYKSQRFANYLKMIYKGVSNVPLTWDLNEILYVWEKSQRMKGLSPKVEDNKFLVSEYIEPPGEANVYAMKKLNPKGIKNRR